MGNGFSGLWRSGRGLRTEVPPQNQAPGTADADRGKGSMRDRKAEGNLGAQTTSFIGRRRKRGWGGQKDRDATHSSPRDISQWDTSSEIICGSRGGRGQLDDFRTMEKAGNSCRDWAGNGPEMY